MLLMGAGADLVDSRRDMSRADLDAVAFGTHQRALRAQEEERLISIVPLASSKGLVSSDECVRPTLTPDRLSTMPAAFGDLGKAGSDQAQLPKFPDLNEISHLHTAANSPAMCDAAAALMVSSSKFCRGARAETHRSHRRHSDLLR